MPQSYTSHRSCGQGYGSLTELTKVPGTGMEVLQNSQKFRVLWHGRTELKFWVGLKMLHPSPGYLWHGRTELTEVAGTGIKCRAELTEVPGTGMNVLQIYRRSF